MNSIPQAKNGAQPQAPAAPQDVFNRATTNHNEPQAPPNRAGYFAQSVDEPEKAVIQIVLSSPAFAAAVHKQFDAVKSTDFKNPAFAAIYGASGVLAAAKRPATREAIAGELRDWQNDDNGNRTRADLEAALQFIETAPEIPVSEKTIAIAKTKAREIKDRREAENPPVDANEIKREAKGIAREAQAATRLQPERPPAFELLSFKDLAKMPRPKSLIYSILTEATASALTAKSGDFKSFISLSMALSVATGRAWFGNDVKQGAVVYVAAEGFYTMFDRATAWAQSHGVELPENFHIVKAPVNLADARVVAAFRESVEAVNPDLIVLDTLSQCAIGVNENDNAAMADFVRGMMFLGSEIGAHVQVLHHNAKSTGTFRGAGAIIANIDTHISLDRPEGDETNTVFVRCEKQRGEPFEPFALRGEKVTLPFLDEKDKPISTLVFTECGDVVTAKTEKHASSKRAEKTRADLMEVFDRQFDEATAKGFDGVKVGFWKEAVEEADAPVCSTATFWAYRTKLESDGTIVQCGTHKGSPFFRRAKSTPSTPSTPNQSTASEPITASEEYSKYSNNPLGVGVLGVPLAEGQELDNALPEMPKAKQAKKKNAKADSEAYKSEELI